MFFSWPFLPCCCTCQKGKEEEVELIPVDYDEIDHAKLKKKMNSPDTFLRGHGKNEFTVYLSVVNGMPIGLGISKTRQKRALKIKVVKEGSAADMWNKDHPDKLLEPGDVITQVNGIVDDTDDMITECAKASSLEFVLEKQQ